MQPSPTPTKPDPAKAPGLPHEADIGSGETTPGQRETEKHIAEIPALPEQPGGKQPG